MQPLTAYCLYQYVDTVFCIISVVTKFLHALFVTQVVRFDVFIIIIIFYGDLSHLCSPLVFCTGGSFIVRGINNKVGGRKNYKANYRQ